MTGPVRRRLIAGLLGGVVVTTALCLNLPDLGDRSNFVGDETLWLGVSNKLFRLFWIDHRFADPAWGESYSGFGSEHPQIGKYVIGLGTFSVGYGAEPFTPYWWYWDRDLAWNLEHDGVPPAPVVEAGRRPVAVLGALAVVAFFGLVAATSGWGTAALASAALIGAGLVTAYSRRAMIDVPALAFSLVTLLASVSMLRSLRLGRPRAALRLAVPAGIACGLAVGSKLNALLVAATCALVLLLEAVHRRDRPSGSRIPEIACLAAFGACAAAVFYGSNPFLYGNLVGGVRHLLGNAAAVAAIPLFQLRTPAERVLAVWDGTRIHAPLARLGIPLDIGLLLLGALALVAERVRSRTEFRARSLDLVSAWIVLSYLGTTLWLPHPWERYYLPLQPCNAFLEAFGVVWLVGRVRARLAARRAVPSASP